MQPWKISVGLTAIICAGGLLLAGEGFSWISPTFGRSSPISGSPSRGTEGWPWAR